MVVVFFWVLSLNIFFYFHFFTPLHSFFYFPPFLLFFYSSSPSAFLAPNSCYLLLFDVFCFLSLLLLSFSFFYPAIPCFFPLKLFLPFLLGLFSIDILCKELSESLDLTRSSLTKRLRKTRYYVWSYTFCNRPSNLVTTVQFKPGLKATKIAPNAN